MSAVAVLPAGADPDRLRNLSPLAAGRLRGLAGQHPEIFSASAVAVARREQRRLHPAWSVEQVQVAGLARIAERHGMIR